MKVTQTIQSLEIDYNEPVEVVYYTGDSHVEALSALVQAAASNSPHYRVLAVRIEL